MDDRGIKNFASAMAHGARFASRILRTAGHQYLPSIQRHVGHRRGLVMATDASGSVRRRDFVVHVGLLERVHRVGNGRVRHSNVCLK